MPEFYIIFPLSFCALFISVYLANKVIPLQMNAIKHPEIDGIRGYLAFFVFLHHAYAWREYLRSGEWTFPASNLFNHFGQTSVGLFFMITAFLFVSKLLKAKDGNFDWVRYIRSRFLRMAPMYWFTVIVIVVIVAILSGFSANEPFALILKNVLIWIAFTVCGSVDINGVADTFTINSGVAWTLPYEWFFYFLLPLIGLISKVRVPKWILIVFLAIAALIAVLNHSSLRNLTPFLAGIAAAVIVNRWEGKSVLQKPAFTIAAIALMALSIAYFHSGQKPVPVLITGFLFLIVASGNSLFGLLTTGFSRKFGQITYSIYLLHGIILFTAFRFGVGFEQAALLSDFEFCAIVALCTVPLIIISQVTYRFIELPFINFMKRN